MYVDLNLDLNVTSQVWEITENTGRLWAQTPPPPPQLILPAQCLRLWRTFGCSQSCIQLLCCSSQRCGTALGWWRREQIVIRQHSWCCRGASGKYTGSLSCAGCRGGTNVESGNGGCSCVLILHWGRLDEVLQGGWQQRGCGEGRIILLIMRPNFISSAAYRGINDGTIITVLILLWVSWRPYHHASLALGRCILRSKLRCFVLLLHHHHTFFYGLLHRFTDQTAQV